MRKERSSTFALGRFLFRAVPLAVAAAVVWKLTVGQNAAFTVWLTKLLHRAAGCPAPYLYCDETRLFWHATLFPPVVALTLASYWLPWPARVVRTAAGYLFHCGLTAVAITLNESPYLQPNPLLTPLTSTLVNANYLMFGVVIWVLIAGPWYERDLRRNPVPNSSPATRSPFDPPPPAVPVESRRRVIRTTGAVLRSWLTRVVLLWIGVALVVPVFAFTGSGEGMAARARVAAAMRKVPFFPHPSGAEDSVDHDAQRRRDAAVKDALAEIERAIRADEQAGRRSGPLWHLAGHLINSLRPDDPQVRDQLKRQAALALIQALKTRTR